MLQTILAFFYKNVQLISQLANSNVEELEKNKDRQENSKDFKYFYESYDYVSSANAVRMTVTRETIMDIVKSNKVVIFSKTSCPYCKMAKEVFNKLKEPYTAIELDKNNDGEEYQNILEEMTGARTVPRVFVDGKCLGGGSDVKAMYGSGELAKYFE